MKSKFLTICFLFLIIFTSLAQNPFITTWKTNTQYLPNSTTITIPTTGTGYNYEVDWNDDGIYDQTGITGDVTHDFGAIGTYKIRIRGAFPRIYFGYSPDSHKILEINQWGDIAWQSMERAFATCINLTLQANDTPNLSEVSSMAYMFFYCLQFNQNINNWNIENVVDLSGMFALASLFNQPLNNWNTQNATTMKSMFSEATSFNQPIGNWNIQNVTNLSYMFSSAISFNQPLNNWDIQNVTDLSAMFAGAKLFNQPLNNWNTQQVVNMSRMFFGAHLFNMPIGIWNTTNVQNMSKMFSSDIYTVPKFNQSLNNWNTQSVTNMASMFENANLFNQPLDNWNTQNVTNMSKMFAMNTSYSSNFNQSLNNWNTQKVTDMSWMFYSAWSFNQPLNNWDTQNVTNMQEMFEGAILFNQPLDNWKTHNVTNMTYMFTYTDSFNQPLNNWNTQKVAGMDGVFYEARGFNQSLSNWNLKNVGNLGLFFLNSNIDCINYAATLIGWANNPDTPNGKTLGASSLQYGTYAVNARNTLISKGWTIIGDNLTGDTNCNCTEMYTVNSGNWNDATTWSCGRVPTAVDDVQIKSPNVITLNSNQTFTAKNIFVEPGSTLDLKDGAIIILSN